MKLSLILLFSFFWFFSLYSQNKPVRFQHLTAKEGLSQGHILCMIQDTRGYIWAGTYHGLNRYNGYNFDVFYADGNTPYSLFIDVVFSLFEDREGKIWCGTWGIDIFDPATGAFTHLPGNEGPGSISAGEVSAIIEDNKGFMWFATQGGGLNKYNPVTGEIEYFAADETDAGSLHSDFINDLVTDNSNFLWIATEDGGLSRMNFGDESIMTYRHDNLNLFSIPSDKISCLFKDREGRIWMGDNNGYIACYEDHENKFIRYHCCPEKLVAKKARIMQIAQDMDGNFLLATQGDGLIVFNPHKKQSQQYFHNPSDAESILSNENSSLLVDNTGTIFLGSFGRGISKYSPFSSKFQVYTVPDQENTGGEINAFTDAIEDEKGHLITGTYSGFLVFDTSTWNFKHYLPGSSYEDNKILTLKLGPDGDIWVSSMRNLHRYDADFNKIRSYNFDPSLKDHSIYSIEFDHENNLWIALFTKGLLKIPETEWRNTKKTYLDHTLYQLDYNDPSSISGNQQWIILHSPDSSLWIGGVGGLDKYNYKAGNFTRIFYPGAIKTLDLDSKGRIWAGTIGKGLFMYDISSKEQRKFTVRDGLSHSFIYGIVIDINDHIWISSEGGLTRFSIDDENFKNYDRRDGLINDHFDDKSESKLSDGSIYMGTNYGFTIFKPEEIKDDTTQSHIVLTRISINNESMNFYKAGKKRKENQIPVNELERIDLWPTEKDITLNFAALHYAAPHKIQYAYMLKGYDRDWIYTNATNRQAKYTNLDGGQYTFLVRATNSDGFWTQKPLSLDIIVHPPFHKTSAFFLLLITSFLCIAYLIFRWRLGSEVRQKKTLEKVVEERTRKISAKNLQLEQIAKNLKESNALLEERQQFIEEQSEELSAQRDELALSNATKDKLLSVIAHDLKNPFNVIMGYSELLLANFAKWNTDKILYFISLLRETSQSAYNLLENLLNWSRSQSGNLNFNPSPHKAQDILQTMVNELNSLAQKKSINIITEVTDPELTVNADMNMITTILRNLITNAIKFSNKGSEIDIRVEKYSKKYAVFIVRDKGVGITPEDAENLFQFNKSKTSIGTDGEKGTGLGLVLCKDFVDYHKGKIWIESELNQGTTCRFTIPLAV